MRRAISPLPQYAFKAWCSVKKHRNNFTFTLTYLRMIGLLKVYPDPKFPMLKCKFSYYHCRDCYVRMCDMSLFTCLFIYLFNLRVSQKIKGLFKKSTLIVNIQKRS
jgi:hypothetical protein